MTEIDIALGVVAALVLAMSLFTNRSIVVHDVTVRPLTRWLHHRTGRPS